MRIQFSRVENSCHPLIINHKELEIVSHAKVLGVIISNDLKWSHRVWYQKNFYTFVLLEAA